MNNYKFIIWSLTYRGIDIDKIIKIDHKIIEVYPEDIYEAGQNKPHPGMELNIPAVLIFNQMGIRDLDSNSKKLGKYKRWSRSLPFTTGVEFEPEFDRVKIRVRHF